MRRRSCGRRLPGCCGASSTFTKTWPSGCENMATRPRKGGEEGCALRGRFTTKLILFRLALFWSAAVLCTAALVFLVFLVFAVPCEKNRIKNTKNKSGRAKHCRTPKKAEVELTGSC